MSKHIRAAADMERSAVDDLLFVFPQVSEGVSTAVERVIPQLLDELFAIRSRVESITGRAMFLMHREERDESTRWSTDSKRWACDYFKPSRILWGGWKRQLKSQTD